MPEVIGTSIVPDVPVPFTSDGALTDTGRSTTGIRTLVGPERVTEPLAHLPNGAFVRVNSKLTVSMSPARFATKESSLRKVRNPGTLAEIFQTPFICEVKVRRNVEVAVS